MEKSALIGLVILAGCQSPSYAGEQQEAALTSSDAGISSPFDGTYAFVSVTKLNETYSDATEHIRSCPDWNGARLLVKYGHAQYPRRNPHYYGTVGPQGDLSMRFESTPDGR